MVSKSSSFIWVGWLVGRSLLVLNNQHPQAARLVGVGCGAGVGCVWGVCGHLMRGCALPGALRGGATRG